MNKKILIFLTLFLSSLVSPLISCSGELATDVRKLTFPSEYSLGNLSLNRKDHGMFVAQVGPAKGTIVVKVPANEILLLEINPSSIEHPERLAKIPTANVDRVRLSYMSVTDDSQSFCDRALKNLPLFNHPVQIECTRSDVTDAGILNFKSLSQITSIDCFWGGLQGDFLKDSSKMPNLTILSIPLNPLKGDNLKFLSSYKNLKELNLAQCGLTDEHTSAIGGCEKLSRLSFYQNRGITDKTLLRLGSCKSIEFLDLRADNKITDGSVKIIAQMTKLKTLNLEGTSITADALLQLRSLKLLFLGLPRHYYEVEMLKLRKAFPKTTLTHPSFAPSKDLQDEWAPLK